MKPMGLGQMNQLERDALFRAVFHACECRTEPSVSERIRWHTLVCPHVAVLVREGLLHRFIFERHERARWERGEWNA